MEQQLVSAIDTDQSAGRAEGGVAEAATQRHDTEADVVEPATPHHGNEAGMTTVEYAVGTVVAAAFAAVLYRIVTGDSIIAGLTNLINSALSTSF